MRKDSVGLLYAVLIGMLTASGAQAEPLRLTGVNLAGAEFGSAIPGRHGVDYIYPRASDVEYFRARGMNVIRLPFRWERLQPAPHGELDTGELSLLKEAVDLITSRGLAIIISPHDYARYKGAVIGSDAVPFDQFADLWRRLALIFRGNDLAIFGLMNEPHDMPTEQWRDGANHAIAAIRTAEAANLILVPGNAWSGGHNWSSSQDGTPNAVALESIHDPADNYAFEIHQYFDADFSGTHETCQDPEIGPRSLTGVTQWLRDRGKRGFLGEFGAAANEVCLEALEAVLSNLEAGRDVWTGWTYWAAGPWWGDYPLSVQPGPEGDRPQMRVLMRHAQSLSR